MSAPNAPTLAVVNDGTGTSATATLDGDAGLVHRLYYRKFSTRAWTAGLTRTGDGTIQQTGLIAGTWYEFLAVSDDAGALSLPSAVAVVRLQEDDTSILELVRTAIKGRLAELQAAGVLTLVTCPKRFGLAQTYQDKEALLRQVEGAAYDPDNRESKSLPSAGCMAWHRRFFLYYWRRLSEKSALEIDAELNVGVAAITDALCDVDRPFEDPTFYLDVEEDVPVQSPDRSCDGRLLTLHAMFEHRAGDAASQT